MRSVLGNLIWWALRKADTSRRVNDGEGWRYAKLDESIEDMATEIAHVITEANDLNIKLHEQDAVIAVLKAEHLKRSLTPTTPAISAASKPVVAKSATARGKRKNVRSR